MLLMQYSVAKRDCPSGEWNPILHRDKHSWIWCVSVDPRPFGENVTGLPFGHLDDAPPGTWFAEPGQLIHPTAVAEKEERGEVVIIRLVIPEVVAQ